MATLFCLWLLCAYVGREAPWLVDSRLGAHIPWVLDLINFSDEKLGQITNRYLGNKPALVPLSREGLGEAAQIKPNEKFFFLPSKHREGVSVLTSCVKSIQVPVLMYMAPPFLVPSISSSFQVWVWARTITSSSQRDRKSLNLPKEPLSKLKALLEPNC